MSTLDLSSFEARVAETFAVGCPLWVECLHDASTITLTDVVLKRALLLGADVLWAAAANLHDSQAARPSSQASRLHVPYITLDVLIVWLSKQVGLSKAVSRALGHVVKTRADQCRPTFVFGDVALSSLRRELRATGAITDPERTLVIRSTCQRTKQPNAISVEAATRPLPQAGARQHDAEPHNVAAAAASYSTHTTHVALRRLSYGPLSVDLTNLAVEVGGTRRSLQPLQRRILVYMLANKHRAVRRDEFLTHVWESHHTRSCSNVRRQIHGLRRALGQAGSLIETLHNTGWGIGLGLTEDTKALASASQRDAVNSTRYVPAKGFLQ